MKREERKKRSFTYPNPKGNKWKRSKFSLLRGHPCSLLWTHREQCQTVLYFCRGRCKWKGTHFSQTWKIKSHASGVTNKRRGGLSSLLLPSPSINEEFKTKLLMNHYVGESNSLSKYFV